MGFCFGHHGRIYGSFSLLLPRRPTVGLVEDRRQQTRQEQNTSFFWPHFLDLSIFHNPNRSECVSLCIVLVFFSCSASLLSLRQWITLQAWGHWERGAWIHLCFFF